MMVGETFSAVARRVPSDRIRVRNQDRHLMRSAPEPPRRKAACLLRWFQTGHHDARQNIASTRRLGRQPPTVDPAIP